MIIIFRIRAFCIIVLCVRVISLILIFIHLVGLWCSSVQSILSLNLSALHPWLTYAFTSDRSNSKNSHSAA